MYVGAKHLSARPMGAFTQNIANASPLQNVKICQKNKKNADQILAAKRLQPPLSPFDNGDLDADADTSALEKQIDAMVYKLYGLTYEEVKIVDTEFAMSEVEYEAFEVK